MASPTMEDHAIETNTPSGHARVTPKPDLSWTRAPRSKWRIWLWKWRVWIEATFVLSMLEPWEKVMLLTFFASLNLFVLAGIVMYFPAHLTNMRGRATYYLWGTNDTTSSLHAAAVNASFFDTFGY